MSHKHPMPEPPAEPFRDETTDPPVRGFLHLSANANGDAVILTHGAGGNCNAPLLVALSQSFSARGLTVLRCDLPFRQQKNFGPPFPGNAEHDRVGLRNAVAAMQKQMSGRIFLGGHSYGGRQATMLCASETDIVPGLLLLSYPLHPPRKPDQLRTQHLPNLRTPSLFVHGTRDPFGSIEEMQGALKLIPAKAKLMAVEGAGHDLGFKGKARNQELLIRVSAEFAAMFPAK
jgi:predicted alpha/beta-hydrolase family hydrolase